MGAADRLLTMRVRVEAMKGSCISATGSTLTVLAGRVRAVTLVRWVPSISRQRFLRRLFVLTGIAAGVVIRVWILRSPLLGGYLDSDEAVPGLMARHFLHGELSTFYWGQAYGGTSEVGLIAALFGIAGSGPPTLRPVPVAPCARPALSARGIGARTTGGPGAPCA